MQCVLVGNYGAKNIGDEALKEYFLSAFPEIDWKVVSAIPSREHELPRLPFGLRSFFSPWLASRSPAERDWWRTIGAIKRADALVFGGGSLFTDIESVKACILWWSYAFVARCVGTPVFLAFQGMGPFKTRFGLFLARWTAERSTFISVRDDESLARIKGWNLRCDPTLTFDPAFALFASHQKKSSGRTLVLIPRTNSNETFFAAAEQRVRENFETIRIVLLQPDDAEKRVGERLKALSVPSMIVEIGSVDQLLTEVSSASFVLSQRYHGALAALAMNVLCDVVPQKSGDKMDALRKTVHEAPDLRDRWLTLVKDGADALRQAFREVSSL